jgi:Holliday junction resolvase
MPKSPKGSRRERELVDFLTKQGHVVHRVAGSGSKDSAICDLIAIKDGIVQMIEVKSRKKVFYSREHLPQLEGLAKAAEKCGAGATLAVKLNYKKWMFYDLHEGIPTKVE